MPLSLTSIKDELKRLCFKYYRFYLLFTVLCFKGTTVVKSRVWRTNCLSTQTGLSSGVNLVTYLQHWQPVWVKCKLLCLVEYCRNVWHVYYRLSNYQNYFPVDAMGVHFQRLCHILWHTHTNTASNNYRKTVRWLYYMITPKSKSLPSAVGSSHCLQGCHIYLDHQMDPSSPWEECHTPKHLEATDIIII